MERVRRVAEERGQFSWTSADYQRDILAFIASPTAKGRDVIEVGCYRGGMTAQLALLCRRRGWHLYSMDVSSAYIAETRALLEALDLAASATLHVGPLESFAAAHQLLSRPALLILDGDHRYEAVRADISSAERLNRRPHAIAFHDYSLRHPTTGERVDDAIRDGLPGLPVQLIGAVMDGTGPYPTQEKPHEGGHYWKVPGREGALVRMPSLWRSFTEILRGGPPSAPKAPV